MAVVCAGPKAILDVPATLEYLETLGVPVVTVGQDELPGFYARSSGIRSPLVVADLAGAARLVGTHLDLGLGSGVLVCTPVPEADALPDGLARDAVAQAIADADAAGDRRPGAHALAAGPHRRDHRRRLRPRQHRPHRPRRGRGRGAGGRARRAAASGSAA